MKASHMNVDNAKYLKWGYWKNIKAFFNFDKNDIVYYSPEDEYRLYEYFNIKQLCPYVVWFYFYACKAKFR